MPTVSGVPFTLDDPDPASAAFLASARPLYRALRPSLDDDGFTAFVREATAQGLVFTTAASGEKRCVALAAHRLLTTSRGRILFVDDLVTAPTERGAGAGAALWQGLLWRARAAGCARLELDSGVTNSDAHRFYHRQRMSVTAFHFGVET